MLIFPWTLKWRIRQNHFENTAGLKTRCIFNIHTSEADNEQNGLIEFPKTRQPGCAASPFAEFSHPRYPFLHGKNVSAL